MEWLALIKAVVLVVGGIFAISLFALFWKLIKADGSEYSCNMKRSGNILDPLLGNLKTFHEGGNRDYRVRAGLAVDTKTNQWKEQGTLSEEAVDAILR